MIATYADAESASRAAAQLFVESARGAISQRARFAVALSGGSTPRRTYELLATPDFSRQIDWGKVYIFWGDERCVPPDDPRSNYRMAREALLDHVPVPQANIHRIDGEEPPALAADEYEALLRDFFGGEPGTFDLALLGVGEDGHTASIFPGGPAVTEAERWVLDAGVGPDGLNRITLTPPVLRGSRVVAFLVLGAAKHAIAQQLLTDSRPRDQLPASVVRPLHGELRWILDRAARGPELHE